MGGESPQTPLWLEFDFSTRPIGRTGGDSGSGGVHRLEVDADAVERSTVDDDTYLPVVGVVVLRTHRVHLRG